MGVTIGYSDILQRFNGVLQTLCGFVMAMTPPALWFAWTNQLFLLVLATGLFAGLGYCLLARFEEPMDTDYSADDHPTLNDDALAELTKTGPWIHHHSSGGRSVFQRRMDRFRKFLK